MSIPVFPETKVALKGRKGLIVGIANDQSIAWGCAKAFRALGADLAVTYLNEKAKKHVQPLAEMLDAPLFMPLNATREEDFSAVFARIAEQWGKLDILVHSIAWAPKDDLQGGLLNISYGMGRIFLFPNERIHGQIQGGVVQLPIPPQREEVQAQEDSRQEMEDHRMLF